ncbi:MAG: DUF4367 domain-containing protein [Eubacteriales bacterium]|nr:DUF4367 domain-containing protein [Eubacteriales bacterium]
MKKKERVEKTKNEYEAEKLERRAMRGMDRFPQDQEDAVRRLRVMMEQFDREGKLTGEEREKIFGLGGYLEQAEQAATSPRVVQVEVPAKRSIWHRVVKWASVAAIFCVSIVVLTMSSEANREYVKDTVSYYTGDDVVVKSGGGKDNVIRGVPEAEMRDDIKETLNMEVPVFRYKPKRMEFEGYTIYENDKVALVYYMMKEKTIILTISEGGNTKHVMKTYGGEKIDTISDKHHEFSIDIFENSNENSEFKTYSAKWDRYKNSYTLVGMEEKEEFYKILKKMTF